MKPSKSPISGHKITRSEALKGLGDPKTWAKESAVYYADFRKKPTKKPHLTLFQTAKEKVKKLSVSIGIKPSPVHAFAKSSGKKALKKAKARKQSSKRLKRHRRS